MTDSDLDNSEYSTERMLTAIVQDTRDPLFTTTIAGGLVITVERIGGRNFRYATWSQSTGARGERVMGYPGEFTAIIRHNLPDDTQWRRQR